MNYSQILYETKGSAALITLNRPEKLNAWTPQMCEEQADAIERANEDKDVGAIIMTGAGRGFCAGADIEDTFQTRIDGEDPGNDTTGGSGGMPASVDWIKLVRESKPIIAAVNGAAVGIGVTMILPFDIIISSDKARFGLVFIKMGIVPELASTHFLVSRVGWGRASEMMLSGKLYSGEEVHNYGLSEHLVGGEALLEKAFEIANLIAENPDKQLRMTKQLLTTNAVTTDLKAAEMLETKLLQECWETEEHKEAVSAFLEKRKPNFR
ncbi:MAG: enoyl-CoA hydratase [Gammaproteobacteria bacterium]|nr:enoyl-CoA hydratase [Gammaproteobacteria bacterium]|tara:strand:- start:8975 stop:9775 length:801 start_codon:yes stop_codon:yes gene_type:complete